MGVDFADTGKFDFSHQSAIVYEPKLVAFLTAVEGFVNHDFQLVDGSLHGWGFDAGPPSGRGRVPEFLWVLLVFGSCPRAPGQLSYLSGPILGSVFLEPLAVDCLYHV